MPQDVCARRTDGGSIGMRPAGVRQAGPPGSLSCSSPFAGVAAKCLSPLTPPRQISARKRGRKNAGKQNKQEKKDNWLNEAQLLRSAHLQSDVTSELPSPRKRCCYF